MQLKTTLFASLILALMAIGCAGCGLKPLPPIVKAPAVKLSKPKPPPVQIDTFDQPQPTEEGLKYPVNSCESELPPEPAGLILDVPQITQYISYTSSTESRLCWATALAMVSSFLGNPRAPCQVASYDAEDGKSCCRLGPHSPATAIKRCNHGAERAGFDNTLHLMGMYHLHQSSPLSEAELKLELSNGRPVIVHVDFTRIENGAPYKVGHVVVVIGYDKRSTYRILNPSWNDPDDLTYAQLVNGRSRHPWVWRETRYHFSYRKDGCNPRFNPHCDCSSPTY